jgi:hypothetical protein
MDAKAVIFLTVMLLFVANAYAIGISPARVVLNFTPNMEAALSVRVINSENRTYDARVYVSGDLAQYVDIDAANFTLGPYTNRRFNYSLKLPSWLAGPKKYDTRIGAANVPSGEGTVQTITAIEMQLWINVSETPRPAIVYGELPPLGTLQPAQNQTNQTNQTPPATEPPIETAQPQAIPLGLILIYAGAALGIIVVIAGAMLMVTGSQKKHRRVK